MMEIFVLAAGKSREVKIRERSGKYKNLRELDTGT